VTHLNAPAGYYDEPRPEVSSLVPPGARFVIDVGCGSGALGRALKAKRPEVEVRGVELVAAQAAIARGCLDDVHLGGAEEPLPGHWPAPDCVIFADVLEHLTDPWQVVRQYRALLRPGGSVVASIPNVANRLVLGGLLRHRWDYAAFGILDRTHLRFFTRETAIELFQNAGFRVRRVARVVEGLGQKPLGQLVRRVINWESGVERKYPGPLGIALDAFTVQFLIVAD
jgi:SAM-dependent methyltransferase